MGCRWAGHARGGSCGGSQRKTVRVNDFPLPLSNILCGCRARCILLELLLRDSAEVKKEEEGASPRSPRPQVAMRRTLRATATSARASNATRLCTWLASSADNTRAACENTYTAGIISKQRAACLFRGERTGCRRTRSALPPTATYAHGTVAAPALLCCACVVLMCAPMRALLLLARTGRRCPATPLMLPMPPMQHSLQHSCTRSLATVCIRSTHTRTRADTHMHTHMRSLATVCSRSLRAVCVH